MKFFIIFILMFVNLFASLNIQTTYTTAAKIIKRVGGEHVDVHSLSSPRYDPHFIVPKPSLIAKLRRADMLFINGAGLELGWLPPLLKGAHNGKIRPGAKGFVDISNCLNLLDKPTSVSRSFGDVHSQGNPHYLLDPYNVPIVAKYIYTKLSGYDPDNQKYYKKNLNKFLSEWDSYLKKLDKKISKCSMKKVIQYHELFNYFLKRYQYKSYGNIEPLPGISPSSKHTLNLINNIKENNVSLILQDVYHSKKTAKFISEKTNAKFVLLPHDVGSIDEADTLENLYNTIANRLCK